MGEILLPSFLLTLEYKLKQAVSIEQPVLIEAIFTRIAERSPKDVRISLCDNNLFS